MTFAESSMSTRSRNGSQSRSREGVRRRGFRGGRRTLTGVYRQEHTGCSRGWSSAATQRIPLEFLRSILSVRCLHRTTTLLARHWSTARGTWRASDEFCVVIDAHSFKPRLDKLKEGTIATAMLSRRSEAAVRGLYMRAH